MTKKMDTQKVVYVFIHTKTKELLIERFSLSELIHGKIAPNYIAELRLDGYVLMDAYTE